MIFGLYTRAELEQREFEQNRERWTGERFERLERRMYKLEQKVRKLTGESNPDTDCGCVPVLDPEDYED